MSYTIKTHSDGIQYIENSAASGVPVTSVAGDAGSLLLNNSENLRTRALIQETRNSVKNIKEFGAIGNGITDDTAAFQAGIDYCTLHASGTSLYVPHGKYKITDTLSIDTIAGFRMFGDSGGWWGIDESIEGIGYSDYIRSGLFWHGAASGTMIQFHKSNRLVLQNLLFAGQASGTGNKAGILIHCTSAPGYSNGEHIFESVHVTNAYVGFQMASSISDLNCADCVFRSCRLSCDTGLMVKNQQGVDYYFYDIDFAGNNTTVVDFQQGGEFRWYGGAGTLSGASTILKIRAADIFSSTFYVNGLHVEQNNNYPIWVDASGAVSTTNVVLDSISDAAGNITNSANPYPGMLLIGPHCNFTVRGSTIHRQLARMTGNSDANANLSVESCFLDQNPLSYVGLGTSASNYVYNNVQCRSNVVGYSAKPWKDCSTNFIRMALEFGARGFYPLHDASGATAKDYGTSSVASIVSGTDGVITGSPIMGYPISIYDLAPGNAAMYFDGVNDRIDPAIVAGYENSLYYSKGYNTIGVWFKRSASGNMTLINDYTDLGSGSTQYGYWLGVENNLLKLKLVKPYSSYLTLVGTTDISDLNIWHFAVFTRHTGTGLKLYLDGELEDSDSDFVTSDGNTPRIGHSAFLGLYFNGYMSNVMGFGNVTSTSGVVLSPSQIKQLYKVGISR